MTWVVRRGTRPGGYRPLWLGGSRYAIARVGFTERVVPKPARPAPLRVALSAVAAGIVVSAVGSGLAIAAKWQYAAQHPSDDWRTDPGGNAFILTVLLIGAWLLGTAGAAASAALAAHRLRAGQIALTVVLGLFAVYSCWSGYGSADVWERVGSNTAEADTINRDDLLPYWGGYRVALDLTLLALAVLPLVLLWLPAARRFYRTASG